MTLDEAMAFAGRELAAGRFAKAEELFSQLHQAFPDSFEAAYNLSRALHEQGKNAEALEIAVRIREMEPRKGMGVCAYLLGELGRYEEAVAVLEQVLKASPDRLKDWCNLGKAFTHLGRVDQAVEAFERMIDLNPAIETDLFDLKHGNPHLLTLTTDVLMRLLESRPSSVLAATNLAGVLIRQDRLGEARACVERALAAKPENANLHLSLGLVFAHEGLWEEALAMYDLSLQLQPDKAVAHFLRSLALLQLADLREGWKEYQWRWRWNKFAYRGLRARFENEPWAGQPLDGKDILVHYEQGLGDTIQFVRYVPMVVERGGRVVLEVQPSLVRLLKRMPGVAEIVPSGNKFGVVEHHVSLMDMPFICGTTVDNTPADIPYITPYPEDVECWQRRLGDEERLKVALVWAGNAGNPADAQRSIDVTLFQKLLAVDDVAFYSLQLGRDEDLAKLPAGKVTNLAPHLNDFADTAAVLTQLDMVISVDTSVVHLAGALGKPVWMLLYFMGDFRWMAQREDSPWYPTLRIFRQTQRGKWDDVVDRVAKELKSLAMSRR